MSSPFHAGPGTQLTLDEVEMEYSRLAGGLSSLAASHPHFGLHFQRLCSMQLPALFAALRASSDREAALRAAWDAYTDGKSVFDGHTRICDMRTKASSFDCTCGFGAVVKAIINPAALASSGEERTDG